MKRLFALLGAVIASLLGVMAFRAAGLKPPTIVAAPITTAFQVDTAVAAQRLAGAVKFPTVSFTSGGAIDTAAFLGLHRYVDSVYPGIRTTLTKEVMGGLSLVYRWVGVDSTLPPVVLMGHFDVVPVPEPNLKEWLHPPFSGDIADGYIWGRGTLDDKVTVFAILDAVEALVQKGVRPARTVYLTFGHDEEVGGRLGAREIVATLVSRGVKPVLVIDEGGFMGTGLLPGLTQPTAVIGIAEKGYVSLRLTATADGGHSSMPGARTSVGALSRAIAALEAHPFPASLQGPSRAMIEAMAPYMPFGRRLVLGNLWATEKLVVSTLAKDAMGGALVRTTTAPTMLSAGIKDNVLPPEAQAIVNFRIRPGETVQSVMERVRSVIKDDRIAVSQIDSVGVDPSPVSGTDNAAFRLLVQTTASLTPSAPPAVVPYLVFGGTDAKYWGPHSDRVYRFLPVPVAGGDRARVHGVNERVSVVNLAVAIEFFGRLLQNLGGL